MPPSPLIRFPREEQPRPSSSASNEANQSFEEVEEAGPSSKPKKMKTPAKPRIPKAPGAAGAGRGKLKNIDRNYSDTNLTKLNYKLIKIKYLFKNVTIIKMIFHAWKGISDSQRYT